jgi:hypothetical protein
MARMSRKAWMMGIVLVILLFSFSSAFPQVYRWTDEKGTVHFTDNPSTLPKDYGMDKKRDAEKKSVLPDDKTKSEKKSITPSGKPKPVEAIGTVLTQPPEPMPVEPVKPASQDKMVIRPIEQNTLKPVGPEQQAPLQGQIQFKEEPKSPPVVPGAPANLFHRKTTFTIGACIGVLGIIISIVGGVWFLVAAFKAGIGWGLACLFLPFVQLIFLFVHWKEVRKPFAVGILAMVVIFVAAFLMVEEPLLFLRQYTQ